MAHLATHPRLSMQINTSRTDRPLELDADDPIERVLLSTPSGEWELWFFPESSNGHYWRVVEFVRSASVPHREIVRYLDLEKNAVLPLGILQADGTKTWNVVVVYDKGQVDYPLLNQNEAFKFQQLVTGYKVSKRFANVTCGVIFKGRWIRDDEDGGVGELQLWDWTEMQKPRQTKSPQAQSMQTSPRPGSIASTIQTLQRPDGSVSLQTAGGRGLLLASVAPPRVLVLFMQSRGSYKMFKINLTDLQIVPSESRLNLKVPGGTFGLEKLSVKKLEHWNLGSMRPTLKSRDVEKLKGTYLWLQFQNPGSTASFVKSLASIETRTPISPVSQRTSSSFDSLPHIPSTIPIDDPIHWGVRSEQQLPELETERPVQEIHGAELGRRYELPNQDNRRTVDFSSRNRWTFGSVISPVENARFSM